MNVKRTNHRALVLLASTSLMTACGGGGSSPAPTGGETPVSTPGGGSTTTPGTKATATPGPGQTSSPGTTAPTPTPIPGTTTTPGTSVTATPTPAPGKSAIPTPSPSPFATGSQCSAPTLPATASGFYTSIYSYGNISGNTYTQDNNYPAYQGYQTNAYFPTPKPSGTANPTPTATPIATATPYNGNGQYEQSTAYFGNFSIPSYDFTVVGASGTFMTTAAPGCFVMYLFQPVGGNAGMDRRRQITSFDGDNASFIGAVPFDTNATETEDIYAGLFTSLSITDITADSGNGTFTLDNGTQGTMTITGSATVVIPQPNTAEPAKFAKSLKDRMLAEPRLLGSNVRL